MFFTRRKYTFGDSGLGPEKDCLTRARSIYKIQTRPLFREGPHKNKTLTVKD
jgi:hypothetical protein